MHYYKKSFSMKSDFPENKQIPNPVNKATPPTDNPTNS
jgi:hypothetical protein